MTEFGMVTDIRRIAAEIEPELIEFRRDLHRFPELSLHEVRTSGSIADRLRAIPGIEVREGLAEGTGVAGILTGGLGSGRCVMLRADIDALPVDETVDTPWKSEIPHQMHACGHDAHAAWLIGSAMILSRLRDRFAGTVKFVFQPAEEVGLGAQALIEKDRILEDPDVDAVFAAHVWPSVRTGKIGIAAHAAFGSASSFRITITGRGGHGSWPYKSINPIDTAVQIYTALQNIVACRLESEASRVISIGSIQAGDIRRGNIIPDVCTMSGTIRATDPEVVRQAQMEITRAAECISAMNHAECGIEMSHVGLPVINDPDMTELARRCAEDIAGEGNCYLIDKHHLGGENFSLYSSKVPGCYMFIGIADSDEGAPFDLHSSEFRIDESVLAPASAVFADIALKYLADA